ncbi:MAG TPA: hypothetical protein VFD82_06145 [Planctomycetota bacterium]|nr:hypothetical protein [Planctomycetota bacterium]
MAKIGWLVTGGLTLITGIVLMFVMNTHDTRANEQQKYEQSLDEFLNSIKRADLNNEDSIKSAREKIAAQSKLWKGSRIQEEVKTIGDKLSSALATLIKTRNLKEKLAGFEAHLASSPTIDNLSRDFAEVRGTDLTMEAESAPADLKARFDNVAKQVATKYIEVLRTAANAAASATTGEGLAPYGPLEDTIRTMLHEAMAPGPTKNAEAQAYYEPMWKQTYIEVNQIVSKLFDEAYQNKVPWTNLLGDTSGWTIVPSSSFKHTFGAGLSLVNAPGEQSGSGGLSYTPADKWRDYVLECEVKIDSGTLVFYTRIGDKMDTKEVPGFTLGTKNALIQIEYGKTYNLVITTIGNQMTVTGEGIAWSDDNIKSTKSRKGEPGIVAQAGTTATISKLRARHLR